MAMDDRLAKFFLIHVGRGNPSLEELKPYYYEQCSKYTEARLREKYGIDVSGMRLGDFRIIDGYAIWYCGYHSYSEI